MGPGCREGGAAGGGYSRAVERQRAGGGPAGHGSGAHPPGGAGGVCTDLAATGARVWGRDQAPGVGRLRRNRRRKPSEAAASEGVHRKWRSERGAAAKCRGRGRGRAGC